MDRRKVPPLRSLPRCFIPDADPETESLELPKEDFEKFHNVLRLRSGAEVAILPNDGRSIWRAVMDGKRVQITSRETINTESGKRIFVAQALPKADKLELIIKMGTEIGLTGFFVFPADRSVMKWDAARREDRLHRMRIIAKEAAEQSYRATVPSVEWVDSFSALLDRNASSQVLSEGELVSKPLDPNGPGVLVIGPEGGWSPNEVQLIGDRAVTLGPRVLRTETAAIMAAGLMLL